MAYIKGGSVVDGNLYVEGGLVVRNITTSSGAGGQIPTIDDECARADYLIKFVNENGAIKYSTLQEHIENTIPTLSTDATSFKFQLDGRNNENAIVFQTNLNNNNTESEDDDYVSLILYSEPLNIQVTKPTKVQGKINGSNETIPDSFIDTIDENTAIPTEFLY